MSHETLPSALSPLPRRAVARRLARIGACVRHPRLDAALAQGADPWSTGEPAARAAQLSSLACRRKLSTGLIALIELAKRRQPRSPTSVFGSRSCSWSVTPWCSWSVTPLLALAERLGRLEPVEVAVAAQLSRLLSDPSSPAFVGGAIRASWPT